MRDLLKDGCPGLESDCGEFGKSVEAAEGDGGGVVGFARVALDVGRLITPVGVGETIGFFSVWGFRAGGIEVWVG